MIESNYIYFLVSEGCDHLLKDELSRKSKGLKLSYSRKGFLTYKAESLESVDLELDIVFSFDYGISIGRSDSNKIVDHLKDLLDENKVGRRFILNSYLDRDLTQKIETLFKDRIICENFDKGDLVLTLVNPHEREIIVGAHSFGKNRTLLHRPLEKVVPSRAYFKIEECTRLAQIEFLRGEGVLDLGAAPGGISYYFLERGLTVVAVDTGEMDKRCLNDSNFTHIKTPVQKVTETTLLKRRVDWIITDINLDPYYVLSEIARIITACRLAPKGLIFTAKLTQKFGPLMLENLSREIEKLGFRSVLMRQLQSNRNEVTLFASRNAIG